VPEVKDMVEKSAQKMVNPCLISKEKQRRIALHEAGHAVCVAVLKGIKKSGEISVESRVDGTMGFNKFDHEDINENSDTAYLFASLVALLGGKAAEKEFYGSHDTGCVIDLQTAKNLAKDMVEKYAMPSFDYEYMDLVKEADKVAENIINMNREVTLQLAEEVLNKGYLSKEEVIYFLNERDLTKVNNPYGGA